MGRVRSLAVIVVATILAAGCGSPPVTITTANSRATAADHLFPTGEGTFYCKVTDEVIDGGDVAAHLAHLATLTRHRHGDHFAVEPTHAAAEHADHASSVESTSRGPQRVSLVRRRDHAPHECDPTADEQAAADKLVADTRAAIADYDRASKAMFANYRPVTGPGRNRVQHYVNDRYRRDDDVLLPEHVESLVYGWTRHHGVVLIGALYIMPKTGMHGPEIGGCLTQWHIHQAGDGEFGSGAELPEMLHVWTVDMPGGPFAPEPDADYIRDL